MWRAAGARREGAGRGQRTLPVRAASSPMVCGSHRASPLAGAEGAGPRTTSPPFSTLCCLLWGSACLHTRILMRRARRARPASMPHGRRERRDRTESGRPRAGWSDPAHALPFPVGRATTHPALPRTNHNHVCSRGGLPFRRLGHTFVRPASHGMLSRLHLCLFPSREGASRCPRGEGGAGFCCCSCSKGYALRRLVTDSDLDASSQYPSHGSLTAPATRPTVETRGVA